MPARTVLFTSTQKFDGKDFRFECIKARLMKVRKCSLTSGLSPLASTSRCLVEQADVDSTTRGSSFTWWTRSWALPLVCLACCQIHQHYSNMCACAGRDIVKGLPDPINSAFHLTYNMVLNLLRWALSSVRTYSITNTWKNMQVSAKDVQYVTLET